MAQYREGLGSKRDLFLVSPDSFAREIQAERPEQVMLILGHDAFTKISDKLNRAYFNFLGLNGGRDLSSQQRSLSATGRSEGERK
jgi:hypothetical protein